MWVRSQSWTSICMVRFMFALMRYLNMWVSGISHKVSDQSEWFSLCLPSWRMWICGVNSQKFDDNVNGPVHAYLGFSLLNWGLWIPLVTDRSIDETTHNRVLLNVKKNPTGIKPCIHMYIAGVSLCFFLCFFRESWFPTCVVLLRYKFDRNEWISKP